MRALALAICVAFLGCAQQSPFVGKWKLNPDKSQFAGTTIRYDQLPSGEMRSTADGQSYSFKMDGTEYPATFGATASWKQVNPSTWQVTYKMRAQLLSTDTLRVSNAGNDLTVTSTGTLPDGTPFQNQILCQRISAGPGLAGVWKSATVTISAPETMEFTLYGEDGLSWVIPTVKATLNLPFDGKDYQPEGPTLPPDFTLAASKTGPRSFDVLQKLANKIVYRSSMTVSDDGKTLTSVNSAEGTTEKTTAVYDRQ